MLEKDSVDREVYESAYERMKNVGLSSILSSPKLVEKREVIREKIITYYESTEEFEKCAFVKQFFTELEEELKSNDLGAVISVLKNKKNRDEKRDN